MTTRTEHKRGRTQNSYRRKLNERRRRKERGGSARRGREREGSVVFLANVSVSLSLFFPFSCASPICRRAQEYLIQALAVRKCYFFFPVGRGQFFISSFSSLSQTHQTQQLSSKWRSFDPAKEREKMILEEYPRRRSKVLVVLQSWFLHMVLAGIHLTSGWSGLVPILLSSSLLLCFCPIVKCSPCHSSLPSLFSFLFVLCPVTYYLLALSLWPLFFPWLLMQVKPCGYTTLNP